MSSLVETLVSILVGDQETFRYAKLDSAFFTELDALHLTDAEESTVVGAWLALTDHVIEDRRDLTAEESSLMTSVCQRILARHGYLRIVGALKQ